MRKSLSQKNRKMKKQIFISNSYLIKTFNGTIVNHTLSSLHRGSLEITLTFTLNVFFFRMNDEDISLIDLDENTPCYQTLINSGNRFSSSFILLAVLTLALANR